VNLAKLVEGHRVIVAAGSGGVGKTTVAASVALWGALVGRRTVVITIDPARRLASSMGLGALGAGEREVPPEVFAKQGLGTVRGSLAAMMLDQKGAWDALVERHAPAEARARILANPFYQHLSQTFAGSHEYMAIEQLCVLAESGRYDLIVVDTPPTRNAIDFLDAPERMAEFFSSRLLRWLTAPAKSRVVNFASKPFYTVADRILGSQFLEDIAEFFGLFQKMAPGFVERADAVTRTLSDRRTTFVVVSTLEAAPVHEAEYFIEELERRHLHLGALVLNKVLPPYLRRTAATGVARSLGNDADAIAGKLRGIDAEPAAIARVLQTVGEGFLNYQVVAKREAEQRAELATNPEVVATVPYFDDDIHDLAGLLRLGDNIWR